MKAISIRVARASKLTVERAAFENRRAVRVLPMVRGECESGVRPCPYVSCKHNLAIDVSEKTGTIKLVYGSEDSSQWDKRNCSLDHAALGGLRLEDVAHLLRVTRQRIEQIEDTALRKLSHSAMARKALISFLEDE